MDMLFAKEIEPRCAYCTRSVPLDGSTALCSKRGVVLLSDHCRSFRYDPLKRTPPKPASPDFSRLKEEDFSL